MCEIGGFVVVVFFNGSGNLIVCEVVEQKFVGVFQCEVEDDGVQVGNDIDCDVQQELFVQVVCVFD